MNMLAQHVVTRVADALSSADIKRMTSSTQETLSCLKFIGKLQRGDRIDTRSVSVQPDGIWTMFQRTFVRKDSRGNALAFIYETISRALEIFVMYERSDSPTEKALCPHIVRDLQRAKHGLKNFQQTYSGDQKFNCDVETILQSVDTRLSDILTRFPECKEESPVTSPRGDKSPILGPVSPPAAPAAPAAPASQMVSQQQQAAVTQKQPR
jgi:hypothetical protein